MSVRYLEERHGKSAVDGRVLFDLRLSCTATGDAIIGWLRDGRPQPANELARRLVDDMPESLKLPIVW